MKKGLYLGAVGLILISIVIGGKIYITNNQKAMDKKITKLKKEQETAYPEIYDYLDSITVNNFQNYLNENERIVYIGRPSCSDCNLFEPSLIDLIDKKNLETKMKYLNVAKLRKNEKEWNKFKQQYNIQYTPTIAKFVEGNLTSKIEWTPENGISIDQVEIWINKNVT
jgi:thioredoxin-like negative regulator of GroEL